MLQPMHYNNWLYCVQCCSCQCNNSCIRIIACYKLITLHSAVINPVSKYTNYMKLVIPLHFISWKKIPNDAGTPQHQSQFTPKMKANAVPRLLSSLVWIDQYNECNGMTSFMEFMFCVILNQWELSHFIANLFILKIAF